MIKNNLNTIFNKFILENFMKLPLMKKVDFMFGKKKNYHLSKIALIEIIVEMK